MITDLPTMLSRARTLYVRDMTRRDRDAVTHAEGMVEKWEKKTGSNAKEALSRWKSQHTLVQDRLAQAVEQTGIDFDECVSSEERVEDMT